jgi:hypothetical protein
MSVIRLTATFKASGLNSNARAKSSSVFFYMDSATTDAAALTAAQLLATVMNGELFSITKQIYSSTNQVGPWASAGDNGGSENARLTFRTPLNRTESLELPLLQSDVDKEALETIFETVANGFLSREGELLSKLVAIRESEVVDG